MTRFREAQLLRVPRAARDEARQRLNQVVTPFAARTG